MASLTASAFAALYVACAPIGAPPADSLAGMAMQESKLDALAIRDETTGESLWPASQAEAKRIASRRLEAGHKLGLGLFQITGQANLSRHGLTINNVFNPCVNLRAGANHYRENLEAAARRLYNSGSIHRGGAYALAVAAHVASLRSAAPILASLRPGQPRRPSRPSSRAPGQPAAPTTPAARCGKAPPNWDAWGTSRHASRCRTLRFSMAAQ